MNFLHWGFQKLSSARQTETTQTSKIIHHATSFVGGQTENQVQSICSNNWVCAYANTNSYLWTLSQQLKQFLVRAVREPHLVERTLTFELVKSLKPITLIISFCSSVSSSASAAASASTTASCPHQCHYCLTLFYIFIRKKSRQQNVYEHIINKKRRILNSALSSVNRPFTFSAT